MASLCTGRLGRKPYVKVTTNGLGPLVTSALRTRSGAAPVACTLAVAAAAWPVGLVAMAVMVFDPATSGKAFSTNLPPEA
jgi:hypothetical protein